MRLDPRTVLVIFGVIWLMLTVVATAVWYTRRRYRGFGRWAIAGPALGLSLLLLSLRPTAPGWVSVVGANTLLAFAGILYLEGAREFRGLPPSQRLVRLAGVVAIGILALFFYVVPNQNTRAAVMSAFLAVVALRTSITLLRQIPTEHAFGLRLTGILFALNGATHLARTAYCLFGPGISDVLAVSGWSGALFMGIAATTSLLPVGFMFLADERVISALNEAHLRAWNADAEAARHRESERILRESERRFRTVADAAPVMIWVSDPDKLCTYFNRPWLEFTGRSLEAELGNGWSEGVHADDLAHCLETYIEAFDRREPFRMEYRLSRYDGVYRWVLDSGVPVTGPEGTFAGYIGSAIDVTDLRLAKEALSGLSGKLITAHEKERAWIARELQEDLAQRAAAVAMQLQAAIKILPKRASAYDRVDEAAVLSADLARDIQGMSYRLHSANLELLGIAPAAASLCRDLSEQYAVEIEFSHDGLPAHLPKEIALCLFRVLQEAVNNAVSHAGAPLIQVVLRGTPSDIELRVSDRGVGFDLEVVKGSRGAGLIGLKERLNLVHGEIRIESRPGAGTTIYARVPVVFHNSADDLSPARDISSTP